MNNTNRVDYFIDLSERMSHDKDGMDMIIFLLGNKIDCDFDQILIKRLDKGWTSFGVDNTVWTEDEFVSVHGVKPIHIVFSIRFNDGINNSTKYSIYKKVLNKNLWGVRVFDKRNHALREFEWETEKVKDFILQHAVKQPDWK